MTLLLDTHALAWWVLDDKRLPESAKSRIADPNEEIFVSPISAFEMATKHRLGKWPDIGAFVEQFESAIGIEGFTLLDVNTDHAVLAGLLPGQPRDPFDRLIAAQAIVHGIPVMSGDTAFSALGAEVVWQIAR